MQVQGIGRILEVGGRHGFCRAQSRKDVDVFALYIAADLLDGQTTLSKFMRMSVTEPSIARMSEDKVSPLPSPTRKPPK